MNVIERVNKLRHIRRFSISDWIIVFISILFLPLIALSLKAKGYKWTKAQLEKKLPNCYSMNSNNEEEKVVVNRISKLVTISAKYGPYRANCLKRALATWWLLARRGIESDLCVGVNTQKQAFSAHAWIEFEGDRFLIDQTETDYYKKIIS